MSKQELKITSPNEAWVLHREELETIQDGVCNIYVLLDAYSGFCFDQEISVDQPSSGKIVEILKAARSKGGSWPKQILIQKTDPFVETFQSISKGLKIPLVELTAKEIRPFVQAFKESFKQFKRSPMAPEPDPLTEAELEEAEAFVPESYSPCPCASGKKFKFCCQKAFKDITFAMCAAQEGDRNEALKHMKFAEEKVGQTAEIFCRYAICWSFFDEKMTQDYLEKALALNPKHPRTNYILGIEAVAREEFERAIAHYQAAIENYPPDDKFHLNETYNNLGTAFFSLKKYKEAKDVWEKALVLVPSDKMVRQNLFEFIYDNPEIPKSLREVSPFIQKYLRR